MDARVWGALLTVYVLWGSTYLGIAIVVSAAPPLLSAGTRFLAAGLIVGLFLAWRRGWAALKLTRAQLAGSALLGLLLLTFGNGGVVLAERYVPSSMSALLISITPLWIVILRLFAGDRPARSTLLGVGLGLLGVIGLIGTLAALDPNPGHGYSNVAGWVVGLWLLVVAVGCFSWAVGSFLAPRLKQADRLPGDALVSAFWQFLFAGVFMSVIGVAAGEKPQAILQIDLTTFWVWALLVVAAVAAYASYCWLLTAAPLSLVSTYAYVNPAVAMLLGWLLLAEPMNWELLAGASLILAGVILVVRGETGPAAPTEVRQTDRVTEKVLE